MPPPPKLASFDFSDHSHGRIVLTDSANLLMLASAAAAATTTTPPLSRHTYIFTDDLAVHGSIPDPNPHIKAWMSNLFKHKKCPPKIVLIAPANCKAVAPHEMFEFIGWLPQLGVTLVCVCDPAHPAGLPEWAFQLSHVSEADYMRSITALLTRHARMHPCTHAPMHPRTHGTGGMPGQASSCPALTAAEALHP